VLGREHTRTLVVDSGTGTTAVGVALGVAALQLPWQVGDPEGTLNLSVTISLFSSLYALTTLSLSLSLCRSHALSLSSSFRWWASCWRALTPTTQATSTPC
jgi:hypothetical protein